jgi:hypothetical protein
MRYANIRSMIHEKRSEPLMAFAIVSPGQSLIRPDGCDFRCYTMAGSYAAALITSQGCGVREGFRVGLVVGFCSS